MKKIFLFISIFIFSNTALSLSYTREVPEKELQKQVQAFMPLTQKNNYVSVTIKNPVVDLMPTSNKIGLSSTIDASVLGGIKGSGVIDVAGNLVYNKDEGSFYLQNIEVLNFKSDKIGDNYKDIVKALAQELLNSAMKKHPIYQFDMNTKEGQIAKATLKSVKIQDEKLLLKMGI